MFERDGILKPICILLSLLLIGFLAYEFYATNQEEAQQTLMLQQLEVQSKAYQNELDQLKQELDVLKKSPAVDAPTSSSLTETHLLVGFVPATPNDIAYIRDKSKTYDFSPILLLDINQDIDEAIIPWMARTDWPWEVMLFTQEYTDETPARVTAVRDYLDRLGRQDTDVLFLRNADDIDNIHDLLQEEFAAYTLYHETPSAGRNENGTLYFDYSYIGGNGITAETRLSQAYEDQLPMLYAFDLAALHSGDLEESTVVDVLNTLEEYTHKENCEFSTMAQVLDTLSALAPADDAPPSHQPVSDQQAQIDAIERRMEELNQLLSSLYQDF